MNGRRVGSLNQTPEMFMGIYPLYIGHNVTSIEAIKDKEEQFGWLIQESIQNDLSCNHIYLHIDGLPDDPFGHWVFECGVFLPLFHMLKQHFHSLQLLSSNPKRYKDIFYKTFQISQSDIVSKPEESNKVLFTQWNSLGDHDPTRRDRFMSQVDVFYKTICKQLPPLEKNINLLYLPRGIKENFKSNDRIIPAQETLLFMIDKYIPNTVIYDTDETVNFIEQISKVKGSSAILLDYGSSLLVNGFFAENTIFFVLGDFGHIHCKNPKPYLMTKSTIQRGCKYYYIPVYAPANYILNFILSILDSKVEEAYHHTCICWKDCNDCKLLI